MVKKDVPVKGSNIPMLGITIKENCPDIRNTKAFDIYHELKTYDLNLDIYDPWANPEEVKHEYGRTLYNKLPETKYDAVILAVAHKTFESIPLDTIKKINAVVYDVKAVLPKHTLMVDCNGLLPDLQTHLPALRHIAKKFTTPIIAILYQDKRWQDA